MKSQTEADAMTNEQQPETEAQRVARIVGDPRVGVTVHTLQPADQDRGVGEDAITSVAKALHLHGADSLCSETPWDELHESEVRQYKGWAKAAIAALTQPKPFGDYEATHPMTDARAVYFLERFKRDEKMLGPNEQLALDYCIAALSLPRQSEAVRWESRPVDKGTPPLNPRWTPCLREDYEDFLAGKTNGFREYREVRTTPQPAQADTTPAAHGVGDGPIELPEWTRDCQGKQDMDGEIVTLSTRYYPGNYRDDGRASTHCAIYFGEQVLIERQFDGATEAEVKAATEVWAREQWAKVGRSVQAASAPGGE